MIPTIDTWSYPLRLMTAFFLVVLSIGFFTGIRFVSETDSTSPDGLVEHYNGNEQVEDVMVMKFKKSAQEMLTIVHTHILSMSMLFFLTGFLLAQTSINQHLKLFLIIEPFVSILLTFGAVYNLVWLRMVSICCNLFWSCDDTSIFCSGYHNLETSSIV